MAKTFEVEVTVPKGVKAGETFTITVEAPEPEKKPRGQLHGIALVDMTDEQLKREIINANSVLYKAKQRGAAQEVIDANAERADAAKAEKVRRSGVAAPAEKEASTEDAAQTLAEPEVNGETASEI